MATAIAHTGMAAASVQVQAAREYSSDNALVARIAAGDQTAMRYLFARHQTSIYRWLLRIVRNEALADDLLSLLMFGVRLEHSRAARRCPHGFSPSRGTKRCRRGGGVAMIHWMTGL
jgi:hypothetical protein